MNKYIKIPILIISLLMASLSFGQTQSIKIPILNKTLNFDVENNGDYLGTTELPVPDPLDYPFIDMDPTGGTPYMLYNGEPPLDVQQVVTNDRGDLLFFIQDHMLYDYKGTAFIGDGYDYGESRIYCHSNSQVTYPIDYGTSLFEFRIKNLQVVPLDETCYRYLIMWHEVSVAEGGGGIDVNNIKYRIIAVLDDKSIVTIDNNGDYHEDFFFRYPKTLIEFGGASEGDNPTGFAFSESFNINERYLFVNSAEDQLLTYKINSDNIINYIPSIFSTYNFNSEIDFSEGNHFYEEAELKKIGDYYYYVFANTGTSDVQSSIGLHFIKINLQGIVEESIIKNVGLSTNHEYIKGIEFSENGNYLYFTQVGNVNLQYINTSFLFYNPVGTPPNIEEYVSSSTNFQFSHIELARDGDMYLVDGNNESLCSLENTDSPNTGSGLVINNNIGGVSNIPFNSNYYLADNPENYLEIKNYALTKQVDGANYTSYYEYIEQNLPYCCTEHFAYDAQNTYTVTNGTVDSWSPSNNPFRTDGVTDLYFGEDLVIEAGVELSITGLTLYFLEGYGIVLNQGSGTTKGAKLTLDNTKCTAYDGCGDTDEMWNGILLDGNNTAQMPYTSTTQPFLTVSNNSTIEYAMRGIKDVKGGIVIASNSTFKDNRTGVRFEFYSADNQISKFTKNTFVTTDALRIQKNQNMYVFSSCYLDKNIRYYGNTFINDNSGLWGMGIDIYAGSIVVDQYTSAQGTGYDPDQRNRFENLSLAIHLNHNSIGSSIKNSDFIENRKGLRIRSASEYTEVIGNDFNVANTGTDIYGLSVESSPNFIIQNNVFHDGKVGMYIRNNDIVNDEIRHNEFYNLSNGNDGTGIIATEYNGEVGFSQDDGLEIRCNKFENSDFAIAVIDGNIAKSQYGDNGIGPVGNWFDHNNNAGGDTDFHIENSPIDYSYHQHPYNAAQELRLDWDNPYPYYNITEGDVGDFYTYSDMSVSNVGDPSIQTWESACEDKYPTGGGIDPIGFGLRSVMETADDFKNESETKEDELETKVDGGNTILLKSKVDNLDNQNYINTCEELLEVGAYLSDDVLISFMQNEIDRPVAKTIVLLSNPILPNMAKQEIDNTNIPSYYKSYLKQLQNSRNPREVKEMEISSLKKQAEQLTTKMISYGLLKDAMPEKLDSIITWLEEKQDLASYYRLHALYIRKGQYDNANLNLVSLVSEAQLGNNKDLIKAENYKIIQQINMQVIQNPDEESGIVRDHLSDLLDIADLTGKESGIARAMLYEYDSTTYADYKTQYPLPSKNRSANMSNVQANSNDKGSKEAMISVFPNPTNGILNVEYINLGGNPTINIYDLKGTTIKSFKVQKEFGFKTFDVTDLSKGVYLIGFGKGQTTKFIVK